MSVQSYNVYEGLTSVDYVSTVNIVGTYNNGPTNSGIGSYLNIPSNTFSVDLNQVKVGDSLLLIGQTNPNENGIYICIETDGIYSFSIIQRREDFHSVEQMRAGQYISCGSGEINPGSIFTLIDPLPNTIGIDPIIFNSSSPNSKTININQSILSDVEQPPLDYVLLQNLTANVTVPIEDPNVRLIGESTLMNVNGMTHGVLIADANQLKMTGTVSVTDGIIAVSANNLDLTEANLNGAQIGINLIELNGIQTPTDIHGLSMQIFLNFSGLTVPTFTSYIGDANYLFKTDAASSYIATAGTGVGQAGDTTHCNAQNVLKVNINGSDKFIPMFDTN